MTHPQRENYQLKKQIIKRLHLDIDEFGPLHILVDDFNVKDHHLLFCLLELLRQEHPEIYQKIEVQYLEILSHFSDNQRMIMVCEAAGADPLGYLESYD